MSLFSIEKENAIELESVDPGDPRVIQLILERMNSLTPKQWKERLEWTPIGLEHKRVCVNTNEHSDANPSEATSSDEAGKFNCF